MFVNIILQDFNTVNEMSTKPHPHFETFGKSYLIQAGKVKVVIIIIISNY